VCSLRAVYKELAKLQQGGAVIKVKDTFHLSLAWVLERMCAAEDLYRRCLDTAAREMLIPREDRHFIWHFRDLRRMDDFWIQLVFLLLQSSPSKLLFEWAPHFWFHLLHYQKELQVIRALEKARGKIYLSVGSDSYLDRLAAKYWNKQVYEWSFAEGLFPKPCADYIAVIDEYALTVKPGSRACREIEQLFSSVNSNAALSSAAVDRVFQQPARASVKIERRAKKAQALRRRFLDFFGVQPAARQPLHGSLQA
jgi:hypothetical protein